MKKRIQHLFIFVLIGIHLCTVSCSERDQYRFEEGIVWNTAYHITYESTSDLSDSILIVLNEIDRSLSAFNKESVVSKINDNRSATVDSHFARVYKESRKINDATDGTFDPTLAPLIRAWGFGQGHEVSPTDTLNLDSLLQLVGIDKTEINGFELIKKNPKIEFNFSALAKGYGVDCIADMLKRNGVKNYLVEVGGEIRAQGLNPQGKKWGIGIDSPKEESNPGETVERIFLDSGSVATSGNYRNFHNIGNTRLGHTISPQTGRPIQTDVISATITAPECMEADALATSCMVLGSQKAIELCNRLKVGVMLIKSDLSVVTNSQFEKLKSE